jgi:hypothetical protein
MFLTLSTNPEDLPVVERRLAVRFPCETDCTWKLLRDESGNPAAVRLRNLSTAGCSLQGPCCLATDTLLTIQLHDKDGRAVTKQARVIHARPEATGGWVLGCAFLSKFSPPELQSLLGTGGSGSGE